MTPQRLRTTCVCVALVAAALLIGFDPAKTWWFPSCPLRALTGWLCPLCGSLRAVHALLRGAPRVALALNPLVTVGLVAGVAAFAHDALRPARATQVEGLLRLCFSARGVAFMTAFGVLRNLLQPFGWITQ
jgi:hypothetical protein